MKNSKTHLAHFVYLLLFLSLTVQGEQTGLSIQGPEESLTGNLVLLTVPESTGESFCWTVIPNETVVGSYYVCDEGRTLVFASRIAGTYHFILSAASSGEVLVLTHKLHYLEQDELRPLPPVIEEESIFDWVRDATQTLVTSDRFTQESEALANAFQQTVRMIEQGQVRSPEQARTMQRNLARQSLVAIHPMAISRWSLWQGVLAEKLAKMDSEGKLTTVAEIAEIFRQIAAGLRASKTLQTEEKTK